jgi:zinc/manganese transport system substrate-binding protein
MRESILVLAILVASWSACAQARDLNVVATFTVLADMAREVGGAHVHLRSLVGPNGDPHVYEPTPQDGAALSNADLVLVNGLGLEGWMDRLIAASDTKAMIVVASNGVRTREMTQAGQRILDPHAWNCAANGVIYAQNITRALVATDPADAADFHASGARYQAELRELDDWARKLVGTVSVDRRKIITSHDAFGYMGAAYGIDFRAPVRFSTEAEASAAELAALIDQIKHEGIKEVFIENSNDPRLLEQIAAATGARVGGTLYAESLSPPRGPAPTYVKMFRYNIELLVSGLR